MVEFPDTDRKGWTSVAMKKAQDMRDLLRINSVAAIEDIAT